MNITEIFSPHWQNSLWHKLSGLKLTLSFSSLLILQGALVQPAIAQEATIQTAQQSPQPPKRRTLFDIFFGKSREPQRQPMNQPAPRQQPRQPAAPVKKKPVISKPRATITAPVQTPQPEALAKNPDAKTILVIGDFMASSVADGLNDAFAQMPDIQILNRTSGSSGFVRQDYYDWNQELPTILNQQEPSQQKPAAIIVMIGANDRQPVTINGEALSPDSTEWKAEYERRINNFIQVAEKSDIPLIWLGQPPYKSGALSKTILSLNALYKQHAEQNIGKNASNMLKVSFVDVWDGFVDDQGAFTQTGVDINGQTVRLRGNDGITMSPAGKRKLAFYAEKPLRQLLNFASPDKAPADDIKSDQVMIQPASKAITHIGPMKLNDLNRTTADDLLGDTISGPKASATEHKDNRAPYGRADDFRWPRP